MPKRPSQAADQTMCDSGSDASSLEFEDPFEDEIEEEHPMEAGHEDDEEEEEEESELQAFRPGVDAMEEDEELVPADGAYKFLHKLELDWPCLSFDFLDTGVAECKYPLEVSVVAGTQADRKVGNDKLYVTRWSKLNKNMKSADMSDSDSDSDSDESDASDNEESGELRFRQIPISGGASNRVRTMPQMRPIVAVFGEDARVRVFNVQRALDEVNDPGAGRGGVVNVDPLFECDSHRTEGYGLAWNPASVGQLVSGDGGGRVNLWLPAPGGSWEVAEVGRGEGVLDVAWKDGNVFATAHVGGGVQLWDGRSRGVAGGGVRGEGVDVNAVAWNPKVGELVLTGSDDGSFKIYDARNFQVHLAHFHWHKEQITSVAWHPSDETTLLVASGDDSISFWDMSVEADEEDEVETTGYPAQLLFLHQGQQWIKEAKFSNKYVDAVASTAGDGFNFFRTCNI